MPRIAASRVASGEASAAGVSGSATETRSGLESGSKCRKIGAPEASVAVGST